MPFVPRRKAEPPTCEVRKAVRDSFAVLRAIEFRTRAASLILFLTLAASLACAHSSFAQDDSGTIQGASPDFWRNWENRSAETQLEQPSWLTPVITSTARLKQEIRYDIYWQRNPNGSTQENYGNSKGLALIPLSRMEIGVNAPPYFVHDEASAKDGAGDFSVIIKFRMLAANHEKGDYVLTAFLNISYPTGSYKNGFPHPVLTPTIAGGKGWRDFVYQGTFGADLPIEDTVLLGRRLSWNNAFQYRRMKMVWPELEINSTFYNGGSHAGQKQVLVTPGIVAGRFAIYRNLYLTIGGGIGFAVTHFHSNTHEQILTVRLPF